MYIHPSIGPVAEGFRAALDAVRDETGRPLRVMPGNASGGYIVPVWSEDEAQANDVTVGEAQETGLTYVSFGTVNLARYGHSDFLPVGAVEDGTYHAYPTYDFLLPRDNRHDHELHQAQLRMDEDQERVVAEVSERVVFDLWNVAHLRNTVPFLWTRFVHDPLIQAADPDFVEARRRRHEETLRQRVHDYFARVPEARMRQVREQVTVQETQLGNWRSAITRSIIELRRLQAQADSLMAIQSRNTDEMMADWNRLAEHPRITSLDFVEDAVEIVSDPIIMTHPLTGDERYLGKLRFTININDHQVYVDNLETTRQDRAHPHCPGRVPCFGNLTATIGETVATGELTSTFELLLCWAESFNPADDYGRYGGLWFDAPDWREVMAEAAANGTEPPAQERSVYYVTGYQPDGDNHRFVGPFDTFEQLESWGRTHDGWNTSPDYVERYILTDGEEPPTADEVPEHDHDHDLVV